MSYGRLNKAIEATGRLSVFRSEAGITNPFGQIDKFQVNMCFPFAQEKLSDVFQKIWNFKLFYRWRWTLCALRWVRLLILPHVLVTVKPCTPKWYFKEDQEDKKVDILVIVSFTAKMLLYQSICLDLSHSLKNHSCKAQRSCSRACYKLQAQWHHVCTSPGPKFQILFCDDRLRAILIAPLDLGMNWVLRKKTSKEKKNNLVTISLGYDARHEKLLQEQPRESRLAGIREPNFFQYLYRYILRKPTFLNQHCHTVANKHEDYGCCLYVRGLSHVVRRGPQGYHSWRDQASACQSQTNLLSHYQDALLGNRHPP